MRHGNISGCLGLKVRRSGFKKKVGGSNPAEVNCYSFSKYDLISLAKTMMIQLKSKHSLNSHVNNY